MATPPTSSGGDLAEPIEAPVEPATGRERLTRPRVIAAALAIVDREGLEALTMRALGRELGVDPMAVYHWFPNKIAILQGVAEAVMADIKVPEEWLPATWQEAAVGMAREYRAALLRHPNALPVTSTQPVMTPSGLDLIEKMIGLVMALGLRPGEALEVIDQVAAYVIGHCVVHAGVTPGTEPVTADDLAAAYSNLDPDRFPNLLPALGQSAAPLSDDQAQFETGARALIDGLEIALSRRL